MNIEENKISVQEPAEFLRDMAYSKKLFHHTDHSLFVESLNDKDNDIVYHGSLHTHDRVEKQIDHYFVTFNFSVKQGFSSVRAEKNGYTVLKENTMNYEQFTSFAKKLFEVEHLYEPPKQTVSRRIRKNKNAPSLHEMIAIMENMSKAETELNQPVDWTMHVVHARDDNNAVSYGGGLWTHHDLNGPYPNPYNSISFSYSQTIGIYNIKAWKNKATALDRKKMSFIDFKAYVIKLFGVKEP